MRLREPPRRAPLHKRVRAAATMIAPSPAATRLMGSHPTSPRSVEAACGELLPAPPESVVSLADLYAVSLGELSAVSLGEP